ncbi:MAG: hypothetical protein IJ496_02660, partial [Ruminococcus sp.]|nr:hypothetical protein [Ruminococcus sp.]
YKSFLVQQFLENAARVQGQRPWSLSAESEIPCAVLPAHGERGNESDSFHWGSEQDRFPLLRSEASFS